MLCTATLELKTEKQSAHGGDISHRINSVAFFPDGKTILSGSYDKTLKVWDVANPRPYDESEWEEFTKEANYLDRDEDEQWWRNTVIDHEQSGKPSGVGVS